MPVGSPMLNLDREIESVNVSFSIVYFHIPWTNVSLSGLFGQMLKRNNRLRSCLSKQIN